MASSVNGEYVKSDIIENHTNTQDATQDAWPRWLPGEVTEETSTVEYQEGAWAIWWPAASTEEQIIQDDLIKTYDFWKYRSDRSGNQEATKLAASEETVTPKKTTRKTSKK